MNFVLYHLGMSTHTSLPLWNLASGAGKSSRANAIRNAAKYPEVQEAAVAEVNRVLQGQHATFDTAKEVRGGLQASYSTSHTRSLTAWSSSSISRRSSRKRFVSIRLRRPCLASSALTRRSRDTWSLKEYVRAAEEMARMARCR